MSQENEKPSELETAFQRKESRLSVGIKAHIRELKRLARDESNPEIRERKLDEAFAVARLEREKAKAKRRGQLEKQERAAARLDQVAEELLRTPDQSQEEGMKMVQAEWWLNLAGGSTAEDRAAAMSIILERDPSLGPKIPQIRDEVMRVYDPAAAIIKRR